MARAPFRIPSIKETAFDCPHCGAFARQKWAQAEAKRIIASVAPVEDPRTFGGTRPVQNLWLAFCERCDRMTAFYQGHQIYPDVGVGPAPNPDLPDDIRADYSEAQGVANRSPRGAAALLRLCIQKLCQQLGETGKDINADIASLVKKGLPVRIQQALDVVRVIGNNSVHPGQIDLKDDQGTVTVLFELVNLIAQHMISEPKAVQEMYAKLPQSALDQIAKRDQPKP
jgi:hypothetical protein